jgi:hypothetical protein
MIMTRNNQHINNTTMNHSFNPCRKTMLLILTIFMTWISTYKLFTKFQYDISVITDNEDSSNNNNTTSQLRPSMTTRASIRINQNYDHIQKKNQPANVRVKKSSSKNKNLPQPKPNTIDKKKKIRTSDTTEEMETNPFDDENIESDMNHGR